MNTCFPISAKAPVWAFDGIKAALEIPINVLLKLFTARVYVA